MAAQLAGWRATLEVGSTAGEVLRYELCFQIWSGRNKTTHTHTHAVSDLKKNKPRNKSTYIFLSVKDQQWCHSDPMPRKTDADIFDTRDLHPFQGTLEGLNSLRMQLTRRMLDMQGDHAAKVFTH